MWYGMKHRKPYPLGPRPTAEQLDKMWKYRRIRFARVGRYEVSTIFLGLDHSFGADIPVLFETMVFADDERDRLHQANTRCATHREALKAHRDMKYFLKTHQRKEKKK